MSSLNWFFILIVLLVSIIVSISFKSRKNFYYKFFTLFLGVSVFILTYVSLLEILSRPKPKELELLKRYVKEITLLHVTWVENEAIHLLIRLDGIKEPRLYSFPWDPIQAQEFDEAIEKGRENNEEVRISNPFFVSNIEEKKQIIYTSPAKPLPAKKAPEVGITAYDPDAEKKSYENQRKKREKNK
jgi:energy-coupling factor transporter transmembrane protein EcfT